MKLKYSFKYLEIDDEIIVVPVGTDAQDIHGVFKVNPQGKEIMVLLEKETTEAKVVEVLSRKYQNDQKTLAEYVRKTVTALRNAGALTE